MADREGLRLGTLGSPIPWDKVIDRPSPHGGAHLRPDNHPGLDGPPRPGLHDVILPGVS